VSLILSADCGRRSFTTDWTSAFVLDSSVSASSELTNNRYYYYYHF